MNQKRKLVINVLSNYGGFMAEGIVLFLLVGYVVRCLGKESFGLISLVASLSGFTAIFSMGIVQSLTKHLAAIAEKCDIDENSRLISTSLIWFSLVGFIGASIIAILGCYLPSLFKIPQELAAGGQMAMYIMAAKVLICIPLSTYQGILWSQQRYDLTNTARVLGVIFRLLATVLYFELIKSGIIEFVTIVSLSMIFERMIWIAFTSRVFTQYKLNPSSVSKKTFYTLVSFGGIIFITYVGNLLGYEAVKWVIGSKLSLTDVGGYTVIATLVLFVGTLVRAVSNVLMPAASRFQALGQSDKNVTLALLATKYAAVIAAGGCIIPIFLLKQFFVFWLGDNYALSYLSELALWASVLLVGQLLISLSVSVIQILTGIGKIRVPAMITLSWAVLGLSGVWMYIQFVNNSLGSVVIGMTIARVAGVTVMFSYGLSVLNIPLLHFIKKSVFKPVVAALVALLFSWLLIQILDASNMISFGMVAVVSLLMYGVILWLWALTGWEKEQVYGVLSKMRRRRVSKNSNGEQIEIKNEK